MLSLEKKTKKDLVKFLHTWIKAINNNHFTTWPGLSPELVRKQLLPSVTTAEGHMQQERQGLQSTKTKHLLSKSNKGIQMKEVHDFHPSTLNGTSCNNNKGIKEKEVYAFPPSKSQSSVPSNNMKNYKEEEDLDTFPPSPVPNIKTKEVL